MRIGIDLMGSDRSHTELFKAVLKAASSVDSSCSFLAFATVEAIHEIESLFGKTPVRFQKVKEVITMTDDPVRAVKQKKDSSLVLGLRLLKKKKIEAFISAGNTGALIAGSTLLLTKLPGIKRPALMASLPSAKGVITILDVGGNVQVKAPLLAAYAKIGAEYHQKTFNNPHPKIALLNVGIESKKGTLQHQEAFKLLSDMPGFIGNIEARELFNGEVDVLVTDGFTGNVLLKTAEGVAGLIFDTLKNDSSPELRGEVSQLFYKFNWADYPGAIVIGVEGLVIKCHGSSGAGALAASIVAACKLLQAS